MKLLRYKKNPILRPNKRNWWESKAVFNPGAVYTADRVHLLPRAIGEYEDYVSRLGHYVSTDGFNFQRVTDEPIFVPQEEYEKWGCEDPRITELEGKFYMTYTALSKPVKEGGGPPRAAIASTTDFHSFHRYGIITPPSTDNKDVVIFPEKIEGKYVILHRPHNWVGAKYGTDRPSIWIGYSEDLKDLYDHKVVMKPEQTWESSKIGAGPPPIKTRKGWLLIYHGVDENTIYRAGVALLDLQDPSKVIKRSANPILKPEKKYEKIGDVPNVVFPEGAVVIDDELFVYYGGADKVCCVATAPLDELLNHLLAFQG
ncbi:MAG: glycosidase [Candidatus Hodarchaeota archaeon]